MSTHDAITLAESGADGSLPRHFLRAALLIALTPGRSHGYELVEQVKLFGLATIDLAGIYRSLKAMEHDGLVCSEWESSELGPPRRVYELTPLGQGAADRHCTALETARQHLDLMLSFASADGASIGAQSASRNIR